MSSFADALRALNRMKDDGVVADYAVAGAMAIVFWTEPVGTYDLDVLVQLPASGSPIVSLDAIYRWAEREGHHASGEHVLVEGLPTQFIPSPGPLGDEALRTAVQLDYESVPVRVVRPEYLIALFLTAEARTPKRRERAEILLESATVDRGLLEDVLRRHGITP